MKLLDEFLHTNFAKYAKNYNVNVNNSTRMVHKKGGCHYAKPSQFIPFDTLQEIETFEKTRYKVHLLSKSETRI